MRTSQKAGLAAMLASAIGIGSHAILKPVELPVPKVQEYISQGKNTPLGGIRGFVESYDYAKKVYLDSEGGLDEDYLNKYRVRRYTSGERASYIQRADDHERAFAWRKLNGYEGGLSTMATAVTMAYNIAIIRTVSKWKDHLTPEELNLKSLLDELDIVKNAQYSPSRTVELMYDIIETKLNFGTSDEDAIDILEVISGKPSDCNDIAATFASILHVYGIQTDVKVGGSRKYGEEKDVLHAWVSVNTDKGIIDIDPTWYEYFVPLERREGETIQEYISRELK